MCKKLAYHFRVIYSNGCISKIVPYSPLQIGEGQVLQRYLETKEPPDLDVINHSFNQFFEIA